MALVSIITVNFRQKEVTIDLLRSIAEYGTGMPLEVIVVDNGSRMDCSTDFKAIIPHLVYIRSEANLGFAGGNNLGIRQAKGDYLFLLNNDTEITADLIAKLIQELDGRPEVGLISPLLLYGEDRSCIQYAGYGKMNYFTGRNTGRGNLERDNGQYNTVCEETGYCHGAAMMCRKADLARVGLMDEGYFLYYEELDWCEKFKRAGFKTWFCGAAKVYHKESISVGKETPLKSYFMARNRIRFIRKNAKGLAFFCFMLFFVLIASTKQAAMYIVKGRWDLLKSHYRGIYWNFTHTVDSADLGFKLNRS